MENDMVAKWMQVQNDAVRFFDGWRCYAGHGKQAAQIARGKDVYRHLPEGHPHRATFAFIWAY